MVFTSLNLFALLGCRVIWLISMLVKRSLTAKLLQQGYRYQNFRKAFSKFYRRHFELVSKYNTGLRSLLEGLSEPEFYGDLVYKFRKIVGKIEFPDQFKKIIMRYKRIGYNVEATVCMLGG